MPGVAIAVSVSPACTLERPGLPPTNRPRRSRDKGKERHKSSKHRRSSRERRAREERKASPKAEAPPVVAPPPSRDELEDLFAELEG